MTATIALPRPDWLARLRTIMVLRGGRRVVNIPGGAVSVSRRAVSSGATDWWLAGGAPTPVAVYQPKGAASLSASYTNLVNPGTYNAAPGVAPTWDAATGWTFNGTTQYLTTSVIPTGAYSALARFSNSGGVNARWLFGTSNTAVTSFFGIQPNRLNALGMFNGNTSRTHGSSMLSGVVAIAGMSMGDLSVTLVLARPSTTA